MTASAKYIAGICLAVFGMLILLFGMILSITGIGACIGIPLITFGLPFLIWGAIWAFQGKAQIQQEVITTGIREGLAAAQTTLTPSEQRPANANVIGTSAPPTNKDTVPTMTGDAVPTSPPEATGPPQEELASQTGTEDRQVQISPSADHRRAPDQETIELGEDGN